MEWTTTARIRRGLALVAGTIIFVYGCTDAPTDLGPEIDSGRLASTFEIRLDCAADIHTANFSCASASPSSAASSNLIVGGQDQFVRLVSESVTIEDGVFTAAVTVQNLTLQPFATTDGETPSNRGVRVVFTRGPDNGVVLKDPDGRMPITSSSPSEYYQYGADALGGDGILSQGETSQPKEWQFELNGATEFEFSVLVRTSVPDPTSVGVHLTTLTAGGEHTCGIGDDGNAYCWGRNHLGQTGDGVGRNPLTVPTRVAAPPGVSFSHLSAGFGHTCADGSDGKLYCWGMNWDGQLGNGAKNMDPVPSPQAVAMWFLSDDGVALSRVFAGFYYSCAHGSNSKIYCWGDDGPYFGDGTNQGRILPTYPVDTDAIGGVALTELVMGHEDHICAWGSDSRIYCWGWNKYGQHGDGTNVTKYRPERPVATDGIDAVALTLGFFHSCLLDDTGKAYCWGVNNDGQLGDGTNGNTLTPVPVQMDHLPGVTFTRIIAGSHHTCAEANNDKLYCWGNNQYGQLGDGTATSRSIPTEVGTAHLPGVELSGATGGHEHTCALGSDGRSYCWGNNEYGRLGVGYASTSIPLPTPVAGTRAASTDP